MVCTKLCLYADVNRRKLLEVDVVPALVRSLSECGGEDTPTMLQVRWTLMTMGAILNMQMDCAPVKNALCDDGAVPLIITALAKMTSLNSMQASRDAAKYSTSTQAIEWGLRVLDDLLTSEETHSYAWIPTAAESLLDLLQVWNRVHPPTSSSSSEQCDKLEQQLSIIENLSNILDHEAQNSSFCAAMTSADTLKALQTLLNIVHDVHLLPGWQIVGMEANDTLLSDAHQVIGHLKKAATHTVVALAGEDTNLDRLCPLDGEEVIQPNHLIDTLCDWLSDVDGDPKQIVCAVLVIGNLARDHIRSVALASRPSLLESMTRQMQCHANDVHIAYAVIRANGNFAIPDKNKRCVASSGILREASIYLDSQHDMKRPVQAGVLILLKNLTSSVLLPDLALDVLGVVPGTPTNILADLIRLWDSSDDATMKLRIARIYAMLLRCIHGVDASDDHLHQLATECGILPSDLQQGFKQARKNLQISQVIDALCFLVCHAKNHVVLMNEGLLGLVLLTRSHESNGLAADAKSEVANGVFKDWPTPAESLFPSVAEALPFVIDTMPSQVASNAHVLWLLMAEDERATARHLSEKVNKAWRKQNEQAR